MCLSKKVVLRASEISEEPGQGGDDSAKAETGDLGLPAYTSSVSNFCHRRSSNLLVSSDSLPPSLFPVSQPNANPHSPVQSSLEVQPQPAHQSLAASSSQRSFQTHVHGCALPASMEWQGPPLLSHPKQLKKTTQIKSAK